MIGVVGVLLGRQKVRQQSFAHGLQLEHDNAEEGFNRSTSGVPNSLSPPRHLSHGIIFNTTVLASARTLTWYHHLQDLRTSLSSQIEASHFQQWGLTNEVPFAETA